MDKKTNVASTRFDQVSSAFLRRREPVFPPPDRPPSVDFAPPEGAPPSLLAEWRDEMMSELRTSSKASSRSLKAATASAVISGVGLLVSIATLVLSILGVV